MASPGFDERRGTKLRENNLRATDKHVMKFMSFHAINSDKANCYVPEYFSGYRQPHRVQCQSLCCSKVTRKIINSWNFEEGHVPQCPIAGDANVSQQEIYS